VFDNEHVISLNKRVGTSRISVILPVYNEAGKLGNVLAVLRQLPELGEIIAVDDGSKDASIAEIRLAASQDARLRLIQHPNNLGKGQAIYTGWQQARYPYLLLLDTDLQGLSVHHIRSLIGPVLQNQADMTLGLFCKGHFNTDLAHWVTPWLTGQRGLRRDLLQFLTWEAASGYGFETALTVAAHSQHWRCQKVWLEGVWHPASETHRGFWKGLYNRTRMYLQVIRAFIVAKGWVKRLRRIVVD